MKYGLIKIGSSYDDLNLLSGELNNNMRLFLRDLPYHEMQINNILSILPENSNPIVVNNGSFNQTEIIIAWQPIDIILYQSGICTHIDINGRTIVDFKQILPEILSDKIGKLDNEYIDFISNYAGFYGYLSYELGRSLEIHSTRNDNELIPTSIFYFPANYLIIKKTEIFLLFFDTRKVKIDEIILNLNQNSRPQTTDIDEYLFEIRKIIDHIYSGNIYQANYTQQFIIPNNSDARDLYSDMIDKFKVNHHAYMEIDKFQIISISPELFIKVTDGDVLTKPIKGTRPRGKNHREDKIFADELLSSEKDNAELSMIVDLLRNDMGKSSIAGSVNVERHAELESYSNVHHLVSTVSSKIDKDPKATWMLILRAFPGGSITGVPKIRAMEIIEDAEKVCRGIYTGSIGYISLNGSAEFNIAIRTILKTESTVIFNAGGGIVADSDPHEEYIESLHKAKHFMNYFGRNFTGDIAWHNDKFVHRDEIIDVFNYKDGFFETIHVLNGVVQRFDLHIYRMIKGIAYYKLSEDIIPNMNIINKIIDLNLTDNARLKIAIVLHNQRIQTVITIDPYTVNTGPYTLILRNSKIENDNLLEKINLGIKPIDYREYLEHSKFAIDNDCFDTIITNGDNLLEGGRSNIYYKLNNQWYTPENNVVHGTVRGLLCDKGDVIRRDLRIDELNKITAIAVSNALIFVKPVNRIIDLNRKILWKSKSDDLPV